MDYIRSAGVCLRDNAMFMVVGAPCMFREMVYAVKRVDDLPEQTGRVAVVTGGSRGIGLEAVRVLLKLDMHVIVGSSSVSSAEKALKPLQEEAAGRGKLEVWQLDLAEQSSVRRFCQQFIDTKLPLHLLLCNAGIMFYPRHQLTVDGFEQHMAVNHLGHLYMQHLLLPRLIAGGTKERRARIVNVASAAHACGYIQFDDIMLSRFYSAKGAYFQSKGAQIMCSNYLSRHLADNNLPVICSSLHPGVIYTDLYNHTTVYKLAGPILKRIWKSTKDGAETLLYASLSPESETMNGAYFENAAKYGAASYTESVEDQTKLFKMCCDFCKINEFGKDPAL